MADLKSVFEEIKNIDPKLSPGGYVSNIMTVICAGLSYHKALTVVFDESGSSTVFCSEEGRGPYEPFADASVAIAGAARDIKRTMILRSGGRIKLPVEMKMCVSVPVSFGKDIIGAVVLYGFEKETVSDEEIEFLEQLSALIAFASTKNEYLKETRERVEKLDDNGFDSIMENISRKVL